MTRTQLAKTGRLLVMVVAALVSYLHSQAIPSAQTPPPLQDFFQNLVSHYEASKLPTYEDLLNVTDQIAGMRSEEISSVLPAMFVALTHPDDNVKLDAAFALVVIARRPDSAVLLRKYVNAISDLFDSGDSRLQATPSLIFLNLKPAPPEIAPPLVEFLQRKDRDPGAQASAITPLLIVAPENLEAIDAVTTFLSRPLNSEAKIAACNGLSNPRLSIARVILSARCSGLRPDTNRSDHSKGAQDEKTAEGEREGSTEK
jgi:HEAT repeat protein